MAVPGARRSLSLAVALDGAGWHPAAWREPGARPADLLTAGYWADLVTEAEHGLLDFVTFEDALSLQSADGLQADRRTDQVRGRLDAVLIAARVAPLTTHVGLIPTVVATHTEPFHLAKAIATLDYVSCGRAGVRVRVSARRDEADHFGRRSFPVAARSTDGSRGNGSSTGRGSPGSKDGASGTASRNGTSQATGGGRPGAASQQFRAELFDEAADYVEVLRRLWDSWEDDAEIRDVATGRFVDRTKLHYIDFAGKWFSVKGPSITPRPPQGQPLVAALAHATTAYRLVARGADIGFVTPRDTRDVRQIIAAVRAEQAAAGRAEETIHMFGELMVFLDDDQNQAAVRRVRLDDRAGEKFASDALVFTGTAAQLADLLQEWHAAGLSGFRLRPAAIPHDLTQITRALVPELQRRGSFPRKYESSTLRGLLGLSRPVNRYASL